MSVREVKWAARLDCGHWAHGESVPVLIPEVGWMLMCFAHVKSAVDLPEERVVLDVVDTRPLPDRVR